ncbi:MAG TPA: DUF1592 domain-containing protein [Bryobacterales bacterium]|nr:DUF1592 domain-containing protein [Bryobacterales bacterium]
MTRWEKAGSVLVVLALGIPALSGPTLEDHFFSKNIYPIMQEKNCRGCHVENGVAAATRLHFPPETASAEEVEVFGRGLTVLVDHERPEKSLLLIKPTMRIPHTGGKLIPPGSKEEAVWMRWVSYLATLPAEPASLAHAAAKTPAKPVEEPMRRLTHSQYNNTVRDLLGDQTLPASQFPVEDFVNGFKDQAEAQSVSPLLAEAYSTAAEKLARNAFRSGDPNHLIPCRPASAADAACRAKFVREFGRKAFRRPLSEREQKRYEALFAGEAKRAGQFLAGAQVVAEAMLQAPEFLFRPEHGPAGPWAQYETASRLSYFLWDTMPDAELFRSAAAGELGTREQIETQARRMLRDPKAHEALNEFVAEWLRFDRVIGTVRDRRQYGAFTPELAEAMTEETRRLIGDAVWNDKNFMDIYTGDYGFLNSDLAALYGFPRPPEEFGLVKFPGGPDGHARRAGILGEATFLTLTSKPDETSPTARGLFVREQLLCQKIPSPPPGTNMNLAPADESKPQTTKERLEAHRSQQICASCHRLLDPIGFGLEKYDAIGRRREKQTIVFVPGHEERKKKPTKVELALDDNGEVAGIANSHFSTPEELGAILAANQQCQECVVKQLFRYAFGRQEMDADRAAIETAYQKFRDSQFKFKELMIALVASPEFREAKD